MIVVRVTEEEFRALQRIARQQKLPLARFIREGIGLVIAKYSK